MPLPYWAQAGLPTLAGRGGEAAIDPGTATDVAAVVGAEKDVVPAGAPDRTREIPSAAHALT